MPLTLDDYQERAHQTAVYPREVAVEYLTLGLVGEAGELANKAKKLLRGDKNRNELIEAMKSELGDVLWYLAELANELGESLEIVALNNIIKLSRRKSEGTIKGTGDNR